MCYVQVEPHGQTVRVDCSVGQGLLSLQQIRWRGNVFTSVSSLSLLFLFLPCPSLSSPLLSLLSLFSLSLGNDIKLPSRVDVSLNPSTINQMLGGASVAVPFSVVCSVFFCFFWGGGGGGGGGRVVA